MKKSLVISTVIVVIIAIGTGIYVFRAQQTKAGSQPSTLNQEQRANATSESKPSGMQMKAQDPTPLTDEQRSQLKAGSDPHSPGELTFNVSGGSFFFTPNEIRVKKGDKVKIIFDNVGGFHNFIIDEFKVKIGPTQGGQTASAEFVADKTGTFEFYCGVGQHRQLGQKGTLYVE